jgi:hypothetical protein
VTTAATTKIATITYPRHSRSCSTLTSPVSASTTTTTGISNAMPKARNMPITKLK